jgi:pimeloyl-ACP methyl ester carboxylesterase
VLQEHAFSTLLLDLLTVEEEQGESPAGELRFNIDLLAERLTRASEWARQNRDTAILPIAYVGASTGSAAALVAAAQKLENVRAIVSRGGRPDLAGPYLLKVRAPNLLIVGGEDSLVIPLNEEARKYIRAETKLEIKKCSGLKSGPSYEERPEEQVPRCARNHSKGPASRAGVLLAHDLGAVLGLIGHALDVAIEYDFGDFVREERFVGADGVDGGDEIAHGVGFENVAERARVEHFLNYFGRVMDGENEDFGAGAAINKLAGRVEPVEHRHANVEQSYVGVQEENFLDGFFAVACFANYGPTKLRFKEIAQAEPDNFVIVSQEET